MTSRSTNTSLKSRLLKSMENKYVSTVAATREAIRKSSRHGEGCSIKRMRVCDLHGAWNQPIEIPALIKDIFGPLSTQTSRYEYLAHCLILCELQRQLLLTKVHRLTRLIRELKTFPVASRCSQQAEGQPEGHLAGLNRWVQAY